MVFVNFWWFKEFWCYCIVVHVLLKNEWRHNVCDVSKVTKNRACGDCTLILSSKYARQTHKVILMPSKSFSLVLMPSKFLFAYARQTHSRAYPVKIPFRIRPPDSQVVLIPSKFIFAYCTPARLTRSCLSRQNSFSSGRLRKIDNLLTVRFRMQNPWQNHLLRSDLSYLKKHPPP